jgi:hypothetical protein
MGLLAERRGLRWCLQVALVGLGLLVGWPQWRGWVLYERAPAVILDVLPTDRGDGTVALAVAYEAELPEGGGLPAGRYLRWRVCDQRFTPLPGDPVVGALVADDHVRNWLDLDRPGRQVRVAFYRPEDPPGTVMIRNESEPSPWRRGSIGTALILMGLAWMLFARTSAAPRRRIFRRL